MLTSNEKKIKKFKIIKNVIKNLKIIRSAQEHVKYFI